MGRTAAEPTQLLFPGLSSSANLHDRFEIGRELGRGGGGVVHTCHSLVTGRPIAACKSIPKYKLQRREVLMELKNEVETMLKLRGHPHIVELQGLYEDAGAVHLIMDLCEGGDLYEYLAANVTLPEKEAATVVRQVLLSLRHCHENGVVHRDVKPENILIMKTQAKGDSKNPPLQLKLADFGLAMRLRAGEKAMGMYGSSVYMAPEVVCRRGCNTPVDIWSLGVILYTALCGYMPFWGSTEEDLFLRILRNNPDFEVSPWPTISRQAVDLVRWMLTTDPAQRPTALEALNHPWLVQNTVGLKAEVPKPVSLTPSPGLPVSEGSAASTPTGKSKRAASSMPTAAAVVGGSERSEDVSLSRADSGKSTVSVKTPIKHDPPVVVDMDEGVALVLESPSSSASAQSTVLDKSKSSSSSTLAHNRKEVSAAGEDELEGRGESANSRAETASSRQMQVKQPTQGPDCTIITDDERRSGPMDGVGVLQSSSFKSKVPKQSTGGDAEKSGLRRKQATGREKAAPEPKSREAAASRKAQQAAPVNIHDAVVAASRAAEAEQAERRRVRDVTQAPGSSNGDVQVVARRGEAAQDRTAQGVPVVSSTPAYPRRPADRRSSTPQRRQMEQQQPNLQGQPQKRAPSPLPQGARPGRGAPPARSSSPFRFLRLTSYGRRSAHRPYLGQESGEPGPGGSGSGANSPLHPPSQSSSPQLTPTSPKQRFTSPLRRPSSPSFSLLSRLSSKEQKSTVPFGQSPSSASAGGTSLSPSNSVDSTPGRHAASPMRILSFNQGKKNLVPRSQTADVTGGGMVADSPTARSQAESPRPFSPKLRPFSPMRRRQNSMSGTLAPSAASTPLIPDLPRRDLGGVFSSLNRRPSHSGSMPFALDKESTERRENSGSESRPSSRGRVPRSMTDDHRAAGIFRPLSGQAVGMGHSGELVSLSKERTELKGKDASTGNRTLSPLSKLSSPQLRGSQEQGSSKEASAPPSPLLLPTSSKEAEAKGPVEGVASVMPTERSPALEAAAGRSSSEPMRDQGPKASSKLAQEPATLETAPGSVGEGPKAGGQRDATCPPPVAVDAHETRMQQPQHAAPKQPGVSLLKPGNQVRVHAAMADEASPVGKHIQGGKGRPAAQAAQSVSEMTPDKERKKALKKMQDSPPTLERVMSRGLVQGVPLVSPFRGGARGVTRTMSVNLGTSGASAGGGGGQDAGASPSPHKGGRNASPLRERIMRFASPGRIRREASSAGQRPQ